MTDAAIEARREYKRQWAKNNPEKIRNQQRRYWEKKAHAAETGQADKGKADPPKE